MTWFGDIYRDLCVPTLMTHLGDRTDGTYTSTVGRDSKCRGIVTNVGKEAEDEATGTRVRIECDWIISTDPQCEYGGVIDPETKATVLLDGTHYAVRDVTAISENLSKLTLVRLPLKRRSRPQFRRGA